MCLLGLALIADTGCGERKPGGPGVSNPPADKDKNKPLVGQGENTFKLAPPTLPASITQGETKNVTISIKRGDNFQEDVNVKFEGLPKGVTVDPASPKIAKSETEAKVNLKAGNDAALGEFTVKVIGAPTKGADASSEMTVIVTKK
jgi:hypothetical protein